MKNYNYTPEDYINGKIDENINFVTILDKIDRCVKDEIEGIINTFIDSGEADLYFKDIETHSMTYKYKLENKLYSRRLEEKTYDELCLKLLKIRSKYLPVKWNEAGKLGLIPDDTDLVNAINSKKFLDIWNKQSYDYSLSGKDIDNMSSLLPDGYFIMFDDFAHNEYAICYRYGNRSGEWIMLDDIREYIRRYDEKEA
jgi:hypothetical protein